MASISARFSVKGLGVIDKRLQQFSRMMSPSELRRLLPEVDKVTSDVFNKRFASGQASRWKRISFYTILLSRKTLPPLVGIGSWSDAKNLSKSSFPVQDSGRFKGSLSPGHPDHVAIFRSPDRFIIGSKVPYPAIRGKRRNTTFSRNINLSRPGRKNVEGSGRPKPYPLQKRIMDILAPPTKANNYFANRLRASLARERPSVSRTVPQRNFGKIGNTVKGQILKILRAAVRLGARR